MIKIIVSKIFFTRMRRKNIAFHKGGIYNNLAVYFK